MFQKLVNYIPTSYEVNHSDLTILICAKNEETNLKHLIPKLIHQSQAMILVVDDFSDDNTISILSAYANEYTRFDYITASKNIKGKKQALMDGLSQVKTDWVLLTDADCVPVSDQWSQKMLSVAKGKDLVLGFSPYLKTKGFLNRWIRYEAVLTAIQYFSYSLVGKTYMGVGRNLLYAKSAVHSGRQLLKNIDLPSGDDDLLVNAIANDQNVAIQLDPDSWVYSEPKNSWKSYIRQKRRHHTVASRYKKNHQVYLLLFSISWIFLYISIVYFFVIGNHLYAILLLVPRLITTYFSVLKLFPKLGLKDSIAHWWYLDPITAFYFLFFSIFAILPKKETW